MSTTFDISAGQYLRRLRVLRGMTQQDLAEKLGISFQQVQKYERGLNKLSLERAYGLSKLFNVPLDNWAGAAEETPSPSARDRQALLLLQAYHSIRNEHLRGLVCSMASALAASETGS